MNLKEIKFRPNTDVNDRERKMKGVVEFLERGDRVRLVVTFRGREKAHRNLGEQMLAGLIHLTPDGTLVGPIRSDDRSVSVELRLRKH